MNTFPIADIQIKDRARDVDENWVEVLADLIELHGLIHPIRLWKDADDVVWLVAGMHRLAAHIARNKTEIEYTFSKAKTWDEARAEEVLENLGRNELAALDRAQHLFELKEVYESLHPEAKKGGDKQTDAAREKLKEIISFSSDAARKTGLSDRAIRMAVTMWRGLSNDTKAHVKGTWIASHQACLINLSKVSPHLQKKALPFLIDEACVATTVEEALVLANKQKLPDAWMKKYASVDRALKGLQEAELFLVFDDFEDKIEAWSAARGRG